MRISIFGLGYVGAVTAGCLSSSGHSIVGVDVHPQKVETLERGEAPIIEPGLNELLNSAKAGGTLRATVDAAEAVLATAAPQVRLAPAAPVNPAMEAVVRERRARALPEGPAAPEDSAGAAEALRVARAAARRVKRSTA